MTMDSHAVKRPAENLSEEAKKKARPSCDVEGNGAGKKGDLALPSEEELRDPAVVRQMVAKLDELIESLKLPFGVQFRDCRFDLKRKVFALLPKLAKLAQEFKGDLQTSIARLVDQLIRSGYSYNYVDRKNIVASGAWACSVAVLQDEGVALEKATAAVHIYLHLAEYVSFYDDFLGTYPEFWHEDVFRAVLKHLPRVFADIPDSIQEDEWETLCPDFSLAFACLGNFIMFWTTKENSDSNFKFDIEEAMPTLTAMLDALEKFDCRFGNRISTKTRACPLEEWTHLCGVLTQFVSEKLEAAEERRKGSGKGGLNLARRQAAAVLKMLIRSLQLRIPTCAVKPEAVSEGPIPQDERQQDSEWIQNLWERCEGDVPPVQPAELTALFKAMAEMPLEEQRYRLECVSALVPQFIAPFSEQLKQRTVPPELADLKVVLNAVLQDDATVAQELLEEVSFYPCLLDFTTKRATIHSVCDRLKLTASTGDAIRIVVPRDNVLDGVCSTLNLQDQNARIDVPLEIEFRAGYSDDTGNELVDEGEDQGGLRRQWIDRASRHFVSSNLFMSPSEDAAHLENPGSLPINRQARGLIFVPCPEPVCRCVQDDWQEQFELFGCVTGFAILYKETIPVHFGHNFLRSVFFLKTGAEDLLPLLESVDKTLHTKLRYILSGDYKDLGETLEDALLNSNLPCRFLVAESYCKELVESTPLKEGGADILVTEENKEEFVHLLLDRILISGVAKQVECFQRGLLRVVPNDLIQRITEVMSVKEIELMVSGTDSIDVDDWEKHTEYENGYTKESQPVKWFWEVVRAMSEQARANLLSFATGSTQVPSGGFRFLQPELFKIQRVRVTDRFPAAHTCANTLDLPEYESQEALERHLRFAVDETGDAFGLR